jgi:hypothetical protein
MESGIKRTQKDYMLAFKLALVGQVKRRADLQKRWGQVLHVDISNSA